MLTYFTQCQNIGRMEIHADADQHIKANVGKRQCSRFSHWVREWDYELQEGPSLVSEFRHRFYLNY